MFELNTACKPLQIQKNVVRIAKNKNLKASKSKNKKKDNSKDPTPKTLIEVKNHPNPICFVDLYESPVIKDIERENKELYQNILFN